MFSCKKGEIVHAFKTLPGPEITRLELGGALGKNNSISGLNSLFSLIRPFRKRPHNSTNLPRPPSPQPLMLLRANTTFKRRTTYVNTESIYLLPS